MTKKGILDRLQSGVVLGDGGYIIELEQRGYVVTGAFTPEISVTHPDAVRELHREMAKVLGKFSSDNVWSTKDNFPMSETEYNRNLRENN